MFEGVFVAVITPFTDDGRVDYDAFRDHIEFLINSNVQGLVVCATTGEGATLSIDEHRRIVELTVQIASNIGIMVVAGTGTNDTKTTITLTKQAKDAGADAALIVTPYYNKPSQEGLYQHFKAVSTAVDIPIILYNVPGRTCSNISSQTVAKLAEIKNIAAIKEASGDLDVITEIAMSSDIEILSGDDTLTLPMLSVGGIGVISVVANIVPVDLVDLFDAWNSKDMETAMKIHRKLYPLTKGLFIETNPVPVKTTLQMLGRINGFVRLPLYEMKKENKELLNEILKKFTMTS